MIYYSKHVNVVIEKVYFLKITSMAEGNKMERIVESYYCRSLVKKRRLDTKERPNSCDLNQCKLRIKTENDNKETREYEFSLRTVLSITDESLKLNKDRVDGLIYHRGRFVKCAYEDKIITSTQFSRFWLKMIRVLEDDAYRDIALVKFYGSVMPDIVLSKYRTLYNLCEAYSGWLDEHREEWDFIDEKHLRKWIKKEQDKVREQMDEVAKMISPTDLEEIWHPFRIPDKDELEICYDDEYKKFRYLLENKLEEILDELEREQNNESQKFN